MSFSARQARDFLDLLKGKAVTFMLEGRESNLNFARSLASLVSIAKADCVILDVDAFYASSSREIFGALPKAVTKSIHILVPGATSRIEDEFPKVLEGGHEVVIVDSLNSIYHLFSLDNGGARSRKLSFAVESLSYVAKVNGMVAILSMYRREGFSMAGAKRPISGFSDATVSAQTYGSVLQMDSEPGKLWPGTRFSIRIPSDEPG